MIDLSVGSPDLPPAEHIMRTLAEASLTPDQYGYTLKGTESFHQAVSYYYQSQFGVIVDPETEVVQTMGSQDGLVHLPMLFAEEGDIILVPDPGYTAYEAGGNMSEAALYPLPLLEENGFLPDLSGIPESVAQRATIMILNFPGNPVPALATEDFFKKVVQFAKKHQILVIHDFAYCELIFDGNRPLSFLSIDGAKEVGIEMNSLSKSFNMAGCRIGFVVGNKEVTRRLKQFKSNLDYGVFAPIQAAGVVALREGHAFTEQNRMVYEQRRDLLIQGLHSLGWKVESPPATMFVWAKIPEGFSSSKVFTYALMDQAGVVVTPGLAFGPHGEGYVRIALVQSEQKITEAVERIKASGLLD